MNNMCYCSFTIGMFVCLFVFVCVRLFVCSFVEVLCYVVGDSSASCRKMHRSFRDGRQGYPVEIILVFAVAGCTRGGG